MASIIYFVQYLHKLFVCFIYVSSSETSMCTGMTWGAFEIHMARYPHSFWAMPEHLHFQQVPQII